MLDVDVACHNPEASGDDRTRLLVCISSQHFSLSKNVKDAMHIMRGIELFGCFFRAFFVYIHNAKKNNIHTTAKKREKR